MSQRRAWAALFAGAGQGVAQLKGAGRYRTIKKGNLRDQAHKAVALVPKGSIVDVAEGAATSTFDLGLVSIATEHTWVQWQDRQGWLKDKALGERLTVEPLRTLEKTRAVDPITPVRNQDPHPTPVRTPPKPTKSLAIGIGGRSTGVEPATRITEEELEEYARAEDPELEDPGVAKGASPLGLGRNKKEIDPRDYRIVVRGGRLYESTGTYLLTVHQSPFVLSSSGQLYGGQGETATKRFTETLDNHGQPNLLSPAWAGELAVDRGQVTYINNQSGTFMLHDRANVNLVKFLFRNGVFSAEELRDLKIERVYKPGADRDGELEPHRVLG